MQYNHIVDEETGRIEKEFPHPQTSSETITIVATLQSYYEDMECDLDRRILMVINPLLLTRVIQLYVAKVMICAFMSCLALTILQGPDPRCCRQRRPV